MSNTNDNVLKEQKQWNLSICNNDKQVIYTDTHRERESDGKKMISISGIYSGYNNHKRENNSLYYSN